MPLTFVNGSILGSGHSRRSRGSVSDDLVGDFQVNEASATIVLSPEAANGQTTVSLVAARFQADVRWTGEENGDAAKEAVLIDRFRSAMEALVHTQSFRDGVRSALQALVALPYTNIGRVVAVVESGDEIAIIWE